MPSKALLALLLSTLSASGAATVPAGGSFTAGSGSIAVAAAAVTVNQSSLRGVIDWNSFSIGKGGLVTFNNGSGATLNRVTGNAMSAILGSLIASGTVYVVNPAGVLIGPGGHVHTGGDFVASTLNIANTTFLNQGPQLLQGSSKAKVVNLGEISSTNGSIFLVGHDVTNEGKLNAPNGTAGLGAGNQVLLKDPSSDGRIFVKGPDGDVLNNGFISAAQAELRSAGGNIYALAGNNGGEIRATGTKTINGQVWLVAGGSTTVEGTISAHDIDGTGGAIETSGHQLSIGDAKVSTGKGGSWLLDPVDLTIDATAAATISSSLATTNIEVMTTATDASGFGNQTPGNGDINVNSPISWAFGTTLVLSAFRNINVNATFNDTAAGILNLHSDNAANGTGTVNIAGGSLGNFAGTINLYYHPSSYTSPTDYTSHSPVGGTLHAYMNVDNVYDLQHVQDNLSGVFALNAEVDLTSVPNFTPIGNFTTPFAGTFEGQGHNITNLAINSFATDVGLFGANSGTLRNFGVDSATVAGGGTYTGGIVGSNLGTINQVSYRGLAYLGLHNGGLAGYNAGTITNSYAQGSLNGYGGGGLVGFNDVAGTIATSYSTVMANQGLVASNLGTVTNSYWDTDNSGTTRSQGGTGLNRFALQSALPANFNSTIWGLSTNHYPTLNSNTYDLGGSSRIAGNVYSDQSQLQNGIANQVIKGVINGADLGHTAITGADGYYEFYLPSTLLPLHSDVVTYLPSSGSYRGISYFHDFQTAESLPITSTYVTLQSAQGDLTSIVGSLKTTLGSFVSNPALLVSIDSSNLLTLSGRGYLDLIGNGTTLALNQPVHASSLVLESAGAYQLGVTQTSQLTVNLLSLLGVNNFNLQNASNSIGTVAASPTRNTVISRNLAIPVSPISANGIGPEGRIASPLVPRIGSVDLFANGNLHIGNTDAANGVFEIGHAKVVANGNLYLDSGITAGVQANGSGDALVLATGANFLNRSGFGLASLLAPNGRWLVWSQNPANDLRGGIGYGFKQYNATYGITIPAELSTNGVLYARAPVLTPATIPVVKQYNADTTSVINPAAYTSTGAIDNDTITVSGPSAGNYDTKNVGVHKNVTITGLAASAVDAQTTHIYGYQMNPTLVAQGIGTITQAPLSLAIIAGDKTYDGTVAATGQPGSFIGLFSGDRVNASGTGIYTFADKNAGTGKTVTSVGLGMAGADAGNYHLTVQTAVANISKAVLTQSFTADNKTYDGTTTATGTLGTLSAAVSGDTVALAGNAVYTFADKNAGTNKPVTASGLSLSGPDVGNYSLSPLQSGTAAIMQAQLTSTLTANGKVYDGTTAATATIGTLTGIIAGDTVGFGSAIYNFADKNAGTSKTVTASGVSLTGNDATNYILSVQPGTANITPAALFYVANTGARVYGADNPTFSGTVAGFVNGETSSSAATGNAIFSTNATTTSAVGAHNIEGSGLTLNNGNYTLTQAASNATALTVQPLVITIGNFSRRVNQPNPTFSVTYSGTPNAYIQSILSNLVLTTSATTASPAGFYTITASLPASLTGDVIVQPGVFTINSGESITAESAALQTYDQPIPAPFTIPSSENALLPPNAVGAFQIIITPSQIWNPTFQLGPDTGNIVSSSSFADVSPDGRTTSERSTYAAGAHH